MALVGSSPIHADSTDLRILCDETANTVIGARSSDVVVRNSSSSVESTGNQNRQDRHACGLYRWKNAVLLSRVQPDRPIELFSEPLTRSRRESPERSEANAKEEGTEGQRHNDADRDRRELVEHRNETLPSLAEVLTWVGVGVGLIGAAVILRQLALLVMGFTLGLVRVRRKCFIRAKLVSLESEFAGYISVLGNRGCMYFANDKEIDGDLKRLLDEPGYVEFDIEVGDHLKSVHIDTVQGGYFPLLFFQPLERDELHSMLSLSLIPVKFDLWKPVRSNQRKRKEIIQGRQEKLRKIREEAGKQSKDQR